MKALYIRAQIAWSVTLESMIFHGLVSLLADFGCDEAQGFYVSQPLPFEEFTRWLSVRSPQAIVNERLDPSDPVGAQSRTIASSLD
jgi:hypothetical protein